MRRVIFRKAWQLRSTHRVAHNTTLANLLLSNLNLETTGPPATTSLLELATLGLDVWFLGGWLAFSSSLYPHMICIPCACVDRNQSA